MGKLKNKHKAHEGEIVIPSGAKLTIETSSEFLTLLREALAQANTVVVEFDPQVQVDVTALQLLCSACKSAAAVGKTFVRRGGQPETLSQLVAAAGGGCHGACKHNNSMCCSWFGGTT